MPTLFNHVYKLKQTFNEVVEEVKQYCNPGDPDEGKKLNGNDLIRKIQNIKNNFQSLPNQTNDAKEINSLEINSYVQQADILLHRMRL